MASVADVLNAFVSVDPGADKASRRMAYSDFVANFARCVQPSDTRIIKSVLATGGDEVSTLADRAFDILRRVNESHDHTHARIANVNDTTSPGEALQQRVKLLTELLQSLQQSYREAAELIEAIFAVVRRDDRWSTLAKLYAICVFTNFFYPVAFDSTPKSAVDFANKCRVYFALRRGSSVIVRDCAFPTLNIDAVARSTGVLSHGGKRKALDGDTVDTQAKRQRTSEDTRPFPAPQPTKKCDCGTILLDPTDACACESSCRSCSFECSQCKRWLCERSCDVSDLQDCEICEKFVCSSCYASSATCGCGDSYAFCKPCARAKPSCGCGHASPACGGCAWTCESCDEPVCVVCEDDHDWVCASGGDEDQEHEDFDEDTNETIG
eukprot:Opistho-1_new@1692